MRRFNWPSIALCAALLASTAGCSKLKSRDEMNHGVQSYRNNKYQDAVNHFKQAVELDPSNQNAALVLGNVLHGAMGSWRGLSR